MEFETLYQELMHSTAMIRALVAGLTTAEARFKPNPESWSVLEVVCHLYDLEREDFRPRLDAILHRPPRNESRLTRRVGSPRADIASATWPKRWPVSWPSVRSRWPGSRVYRRQIGKPSMSISLVR